MRLPGPEATGIASGKGRLWGLAALVFLASACLYVLTAAPSVGLGDTALLMDAVRRFRISSHVNHHNISVILGVLFQGLPFEDPYYRATLASAFVGSGTIAVFFSALRRATGNTAVAVIASAILAVSHSQWWHSTLLESYAVNGLLTAITLAIAVSMQRAYRDVQLHALFFVAGLAYFNHLSMGIVSIAAATILVGRVVHHVRAGEAGAAARLLLISSLCFAVGFAPYALTFALDAARSGDLRATFEAAVFGKFRSKMLSGGLGWAIRDVAFLIGLQFPSPFLLAIAWGIARAPARLRPGWLGLALAAMFGTNVVFFATFNSWDKFAFLLPSFVFLAFLGGLGLAAVWPRIVSRRWGPALLWASAAVCVALPPYVYAHLAEWGREPGLLHARYNNERTKNTHDAAEYVANPNKRHYRDVRDLVELLFTELPESSTLVDTDSRTYYVLRVFQTDREPRRPDLRIELVNSWGFDDWGLSPVRFGQLLARAHRYDENLFLISLRDPFARYLHATRVRYRFDRFPLDEHRWIYRLRTADDEGAEPYFPAITRLEVGVGFDRGEGRVSAELSGSDAVMARVHFEPSSAPFPLVFVWQAPDGSIAYESDPLFVPAGLQRAWSKLMTSPAGRPGTWRVRVRCDATVVAEMEFEIR